MSTSSIKLECSVLVNFNSKRQSQQFLFLKIFWIFLNQLFSFLWIFQNNINFVSIFKDRESISSISQSAANNCDILPVKTSCFPIREPWIEKSLDRFGWAKLLQSRVSPSKESNQIKSEMLSCTRTSTKNKYHGKEPL